jgi:ABC-type sugar transport system ATPase subunit
LPSNWNGQLASTAVRIGVRPEHWQINEEGKGLPTQLELLEHLGDAVLVHVKLEGMEDMITLKLAKLPHSLVLGNRIWLQPDFQQIILFDEQGKRISV